MIEKFVRFLDIVYLACIWIAGAAIIVMTITIPWGVLNRYVFGRGSDWPEPVAILFCAWSCLPSSAPPPVTAPAGTSP
jgi:TRAP-type C4-dicarboxylate transport system permease small subunit